MDFSGPTGTHEWWVWLWISLLGFAGFTGIFGAAIRLANVEEKLASNARRRITAKVCLFVGLIAGIVLAAQLYGGAAFFFALVFPIPLLFGILLFAATIGIKPTSRICDD